VAGATAAALDTVAVFSAVTSTTAGSFLSALTPTL
jgi:hypothetical protein